MDGVTYFNTTLGHLVLLLLRLFHNRPQHGNEHGNAASRGFHLTKQYLSWNLQLHSVLDTNHLK